MQTYWVGGTQQSAPPAPVVNSVASNAESPARNLDYGLHAPTAERSTAHANEHTSLARENPDSAAGKTRSTRAVCAGHGGSGFQQGHVSVAGTPSEEITPLVQDLDQPARCLPQSRCLMIVLEADEPVSVCALVSELMRRRVHEASRTRAHRLSGYCTHTSGCVAKINIP